MADAQLGGIARANLRRHRNGFVAVFITVFSAALLVCALGVLFESGIRGGATPHRYAGADVVVGAPQSLDTREDFDQPYSERALLPASAVDEMARLPDVRSAVGDVSVPLSDDSGRRFDAHGWSSAVLAPFTLTAGHPPTGPDEVVTTDPATLGDRVTLRHGGIGSEYTVVGVAAASSPESNSRPATIFLEDARAQQLWPHPGSVAVVGLMGHDGVGSAALASQVSAELGDLGVVTYTGDARADAEHLDVGAARGELVILTSAIAGVALMIALFVVSSTVSLSISQRRRDFALLRSMGATPRQIHRLIGSEVWVVSCAAAVLGVMPGYLLAQVIRDEFAGAGILPVDFALAISPLPALAGIATAVIAARLAAVISARRPARLDPIEALRESAVEPGAISRVRTIAGLLIGLGGLVTAFLPIVVPGPDALAGAGTSVVLFIIAVALLGPTLASVALRLIGGTMRRGGSAAAVLAAANLDAHGRRLATAITPMALVIAFGIVQLGSQSTLATAAQNQVEQGMTGDLVVTGPGGVEPTLISEIASIDSVEAANPVTRSQAFHTSQRADDPSTAAYAVLGIDPAETATTLDLDVHSGALTELRTGTVALSQDAAATTGAQMGEAVALRLGDGTLITPTVVATYGRGLGFGDIALPADQVREHTSTGLIDHIVVSAAADRIDEARSEIESIGGLTVIDSDGFAVANRQEQRAQDTVNVVALSVLLGFLSIAVVNTLVLMTTERRREFALLRMVGARTGQVRGMVRREASVAVAIAVVTGSIIAYPPMFGIAIALPGISFPTISPWTYGCIVGITALLGFGAITGTAWKVFRHNPAGTPGGQD